ncbi:MAG: Peptidyl-dipeptidase Dcp [Verrucomicrobia bacterium]|nr:Peptidyl-dipeptidase Dcp [Verrucomicrobiota bacterium]
MHKPSLLLFAAACLASNLPAAETAAPVSVSSNPLLVESTLPYHLPAFDRIKDEHFAPAFAANMAAQLQEVDAIARNPEKPTFENTIVALDRTGLLLKRTRDIFSNLASANTNPALQKIEEDISPKLAAQTDAIQLNAALYARIKALYDQRETLGLDAESKWLLERYNRDFVRGGAKLSAADKEKLKVLNADLAALQTTFMQNVQKEKNADSLVVDTREELAGLTDSEVSAAAANAAAEGKPGKFSIALLNTTGQPLLANLKNRAVREHLMAASLARGSHGGPYDNREVVKQLARKRAEHAVLLGYASHAAYQLDDQTAKDVDTVNKLLAQLGKPAVANAKLEAANIQAIIDRERGRFQVASYDWTLYSEKVRKIFYSFDESQLKPYFEMNHVLVDGVFFAANKLYGITFKERHDLPVYHPDVRVFEVFDADGSPLALFLVDYYARPSKRGGAWMNEYVSQSTLLGAKPVVANHLNIPKPPDGQPTLLTYDEVRTAFHEFGHALHGMFSNVKYPRFAGTNVPTDFVEYPSQVNEMWALWPEVLANYAKHYQTGEPLPADLVKKMMRAQRFNQGYFTAELVGANVIDQAWHQLKPSEIPDDAIAFEAAALKQAGVDFPPVPPRYRSTYFSHSFGGDYSAGYYSYFWSEVLDADSVEWFKAHGGLTRANGDRFRSTLLSRGGSKDALMLFRDFTGGEPDIKPLINRRGLDHPPAALEFDG